VRVIDATGTDLTEEFPELHVLGRAIGATEVVLEGELVAPPAVFEHRTRVRSASARRRLAQKEPVTFVATDLLWWEGHPAADEPFLERRRLLESLALSGQSWQTTPVHPGDGDALLTAVGEQALPGVVARRLEGPITEVRLVRR
jgi:bifunctional non-homologous end joining protein LigD